MQRPFFWSILCFLSGIGFSLSMVNRHVSVVLILPLAIFVIICIAFYSLYIRYRDQDQQRFMQALLFTAIFVIGSMYGFMHVEPIDEMTGQKLAADREQVVLRGTLTNVWQGADYQAFLLRLNNGQMLQGRIWINPEEDKIWSHGKYEIEESEQRALLLPGQVIEARGEYRWPTPKRNPGGFDEQYYYWLNGWNGKLYTTQEQIKIISDTQGISYEITRLLYKQKSYYQNILAEAMNEREYAVINALLLGDRGYIDYDTNQQIRVLGLAHLFAISGLHIGMIVLSFIFLFDRLGVVRSRTYILLLLLLPVYALLTGATPSVVRSVIMAEIMLVAKLIYRQSDVYTNLIFAAFVIVLFNPKVLLMVGFQLTFLVTLGIVLFDPIFNHLLLKCRIQSIWLRKLLSINMAAQVFSFPLLVYHFQEFPWSSLFSQYPVLPIINLLILPVGVFLLLTGWIHPAFTLFPGFILQQSAKYVLLLTDGMSIAGKYVSKFPEVSWLWVYVYFVCVFVIAYCMYYRRYAYRVITVSIGALVILVGSLWLPALPDGRLRVTILDVGQGDAIHIQTPKGKNLLIDGGGVADFYQTNYDIGRYVTMPYLYSQRVHKLDMVFLSHGDSDHIQGLLSLFEQYRIEAFAYGREDERDYFQQLLALSEKQQIELHQLGSDDRVELEEGLAIHVYHPPIDNRPDDSANNDSLVMELQYGDIRMLFTGDIEAKAENHLLTLLPDDSQYDILKVAHHGSKTSTTEAFVERIKPRYAVIGVGRFNRFGHPHESVIERLEQTGSEIYRTDLHGAITISTDGKGVIVATMLE